jgi:hypothetical protein
MRTTWWLSVCLVALFAACGSSKKKGGVPDASNPCGVFGAACTDGTMCCSGTCDSTGACAVNTTTCSMPGSSCSANTDCCSVRCEGNVCSSSQCVADNTACTSNGQCCSGDCGTNGKCTPLSITCKTDGNPCGSGAECCSQFCNSGGMCGPSSYCVQDGDACAHDAECCGGECVMGTTGTLGLCSHPMPGSTNCSAGIDGTVCAGCGDCCSRLCEVYQPTGVKVCQPAEGCRVDGDICRKDSDCCGAPGTGLPGDGHVTCLKVNATDPTGICRNPNACNPEGDVCHYQNYQTCGNSSARADCCGGLGAQSGVCKLDALGVPRCFGLGTSCQMTGQTCAYSGDCCNGAPCVPDMNGVLHCGGTMCQPKGGMCTNDVDCCSGTSCVFQPGQTYGTCGGTSMCANTGQTCSDMNPCCAADGTTCVESSDDATPCPAGMETGCICYRSIF